MNGLLTVLALAAQAQPASTPLDLATVIAAAVAHSDSVQESRAAAQSARAKVDQVASREMPQLALNANGVEFSKTQSLNFGGQTIQAVPLHQETLNLQLNQLLDLTNQVGTGISQAKLYALSASYQLQSSTEDAELTAVTDYYNVLRAEQNVRVAQASLTDTQEQLKTSNDLWRGGVGEKINVYRATSQVANAQELVEQRNNELDAARSALNDLIGRPLNQPLTLKEVLPPAPLQVNSAFPPADEATFDRAALADKALNQRPEVLAAHVAERAAEKGIKLARASNEPTVVLGLGGNYYPTPSFQDLTRSIGVLTLGVTVPIFDGGLAGAEVREAKAGVDTAKSTEDQIRRAVALQVQDAALDVDTAQRQLDASEAGLQAAIVARKLAQTRYEAQVGIYLEVTDAEAALTAAQTAQVQAAYDLLTARARLRRAVGDELTPSSL